MHILITGGSGFLGARLARELLNLKSLALKGETPRQIGRITLTDRVPPPADIAASPIVQFVNGDLFDVMNTGALQLYGTDVVFHLAAAVSAECEADFDLGMRSNLATTQALLESARKLGTQPTFVFASSLAVYGRQPGRQHPDVITDDTLPTPQSSYGTQKFIGELLVADYGRKAFVTSRTVRLMTVSVRPGQPNGAASGFLSGMIREPLAGMRASVPVPEDTPVALASPARAVEGLIRAAEATDDEWGPLTAMNLPSLRTTVGEMANALAKVAGPASLALLDWSVDETVKRVVTSWPGEIRWDRAHRIGLRSDLSAEAIVRDYVRENPEAIKLPLQ